MLAEEFKEFALYLSPNTKDTGVVMGEELIPVYAPPLVSEVNGVKLEVNPFSFFQVNLRAARTPYSWMPTQG